MPCDRVRMRILTARHTLPGTLRVPCEIHISAWTYRVGFLSFFYNKPLPNFAFPVGAAIPEYIPIILLGNLLNALCHYDAPSRSQGDALRFDFIIWVVRAGILEKEGGSGWETWSTLRQIPRQVGDRKCPWNQKPAMIMQKLLPNRGETINKTQNLLTI